MCEQDREEPCGVHFGERTLFENNKCIASDKMFNFIFYGCIHDNIHYSRDIIHLHDFIIFLSRFFFKTREGFAINILGNRESIFCSRLISTASCKKASAVKKNFLHSFF